MGEIIIIIAIPCFLATGAYCLYFSGWKRGMVQGERVVKAHLGKKIKKLLKNAAKIKKSQANIERTYLELDEKIKVLEIKKGLKSEDVKDIRNKFDNLGLMSEHPDAYDGLRDTEELKRRLLDNRGSIVQGEQGPFSILTGQLVSKLPKPPWK